MASPLRLQSRWPNGLMVPSKLVLVRCPQHPWPQKQPPSSVPSVLAETPRVFLLTAPRAASSVSQSSGAALVGVSEACCAGLRRSSRSLVGTGHQKRCWHGTGEPRLAFSTCPATGHRSWDPHEAHGAATAGLGPGSTQGHHPAAAILGGQEVQNATREEELPVTPALALK